MVVNHIASTHTIKRNICTPLTHKFCTGWWAFKVVSWGFQKWICELTQEFYHWVQGLISLRNCLFSKIFAFTWWKSEGFIFLWTTTFLVKISWTPNFVIVSIVSFTMHEYHLLNPFSNLWSFRSDLGQHLFGLKWAQSSLYLIITLVSSM